MATYQEQLDRIRAQKAVKEKADAERKAQLLSPEQIKNWRSALAVTYGPGVFFVPDETIQKLCDRVRAELAKERGQPQEER